MIPSLAVNPQLVLSHLLFTRVARHAVDKRMGVASNNPLSHLPTRRTIEHVVVEEIFVSRSERLSQWLQSNDLCRNLSSQSSLCCELTIAGSSGFGGAGCCSLHHSFGPPRAWTQNTACPDMPCKGKSMAACPLSKPRYLATITLCHAGKGLISVGRCRAQRGLPHPSHCRVLSQFACRPP